MIKKLATSFRDLPSVIKSLPNRVKRTSWWKRNSYWLISAYWALAIVSWIALLAKVRRIYLGETALQTTSDSYLYIYSSLAVLSIIIVGSSLFYLRLKRRELYGFLEIGVACFTGFFTAWKIQQTADSYLILPLVACVYVVVRGLDNIEEAINAEVKTEFAPKWKEVEEENLRRVIRDEIDKSNP